MSSYNMANYTGSITAISCTKHNILFYILLCHYVNNIFSKYIVGVLFITCITYNYYLYHHLFISHAQ